MTRIECLYNKIEKEYNRENEISNIKNISVLAESDKILKSLLEINDVVDSKWRARCDNAINEFEGDSTMSYYFFRPKISQITNEEFSPNKVITREMIQAESDVDLTVLVNMCRSINLAQNIFKKLDSNISNKKANSIVQIQKIENMLLNSLVEYFEKKDGTKYSYGYLKNKQGEEYFACDVPEYGTLYADLNKNAEIKEKVQNVKYEFGYYENKGILLPGFSKEKVWSKFSWGNTEEKVRSKINMPEDRTEIYKNDDSKTKILKTYNKKVLEMEVLKNLKGIVTESIYEDYSNLSDENKQYIINSDIHNIAVKLGFTKEQLKEINEYMN